MREPKYKVGETVYIQQTGQNYDGFMQMAHVLSLSNWKVNRRLNKTMCCTIIAICCMLAPSRALVYYGIQNQRGEHFVVGEKALTKINIIEASCCTTANTCPGFSPLRSETKED